MNRLLIKNLSVYQHISYYAESKKEEIDILTMETHQTPSKWQHLSNLYQSIIFKLKFAK